MIKRVETKNKRNLSDTDKDLTFTYVILVYLIANYGCV